MSAKFSALLRWLPTWQALAPREQLARVPNPNLRAPVPEEPVRALQSPAPLGIRIFRCLGALAYRIVDRVLQEGRRAVILRGIREVIGTTRIAGERRQSPALRTEARVFTRLVHQQKVCRGQRLALLNHVGQCRNFLVVRRNLLVNLSIGRRREVPVRLGRSLCLHFLAYRYKQAGGNVQLAGVCGRGKTGTVACVVRGSSRRTWWGRWFPG